MITSLYVMIFICHYIKFTQINVMSANQHNFIRKSWQALQSSSGEISMLQLPIEKQQIGIVIIFLYVSDKLKEKRLPYIASQLELKWG